MTVRSGFQNGKGIGSKIEQNLVQSLFSECIQIMGQDVIYIPRTMVENDIDKLFGENCLSFFNTFAVIEMYLETQMETPFGHSKGGLRGFGQSNEFLSMFGIENKEEATFRVSKERWEQEIGNKGLTTLENRPCEGDLVYYSMNNKLFEIKFVDHTQAFYQLGEYYSYMLHCTLFEYGSERFDTGMEEIDTLPPFTLDSKTYSFLTSGENVLLDATNTELATVGIHNGIVDTNSINKQIVADNLSVQNFNESNIFND